MANYSAFQMTTVQAKPFGGELCVSASLTRSEVKNAIAYLNGDRNP
jgi:hypothetical protein